MTSMFARYTHLSPDHELSFIERIAVTATKTATRKARATQKDAENGSKVRYKVSPKVSPEKDGDSSEIRWTEKRRLFQTLN